MHIHNKYEWRPVPRAEIQHLNPATQQALLIIPPRHRQGIQKASDLQDDCRVLLSPEEINSAIEADSKSLESSGSSAGWSTPSPPRTRDPHNGHHRSIGGGCKEATPGICDYPWV